MGGGHDVDDKGGKSKGRESIVVEPCHCEGVSVQDVEIAAGFTVRLNLESTRCTKKTCLQIKI